LERMASVANAPIAKPATSLGPHPSARNRCGPRSSSWTLFPRPARAVELRTCLHPCLDGDADRCASGAAQRDPRADAISEPSGRNHVYVHARCLGRAPLYSLAQWCQMPLKRTLKQEPGRDARAYFARHLAAFRPGYSARMVNGRLPRYAPAGTRSDHGMTRTAL
jgi:hypothetical protein